MLLGREQLLFVLLYVFVIVSTTGNKSKSNEHVSTIKKNQLENKDNKQRAVTMAIEGSVRKDNKIVSIHSNLDKSIRNLKSDAVIKISTTTENYSSITDGDAIVFPTENTTIIHNSENLDDRFGLPTKVIATMLG